MYEYEIYIKGKPETLKVVEIPDEALIKSFGKHAKEEGIDPLDVKPDPMFMRDYACKTGVFPWSVYTKLQPRRLKKKKRANKQV